jgi:hypothetical protein
MTALLCLKLLSILLLHSGRKLMANIGIEAGLQW